MARMADMSVLRSLRLMADDVRDFVAPSAVPRLLRRPSALEFLRDYAGPGRPAVFCGLIDGWRASEEWDVAYLRCSTLGVARCCGASRWRAGGHAGAWRATR